MEASTTVGSWAAAVAYEPARAVVRPVASAGRMRAFVVGLEPHQELPTHPAPGPLALTVVAGQVTLTVEGERLECPLQATVLVAAGVEHALRAGAERAAVLGVVLQP